MHQHRITIMHFQEYFTFILKSIRLKFIILLSLLFLFTGIISAFFFIQRTEKQLHSKLIEKGEILAEDLAYNAVFGISMDDSEILGILIDGVINRKDIAYVIIYNSQGREIVFKDPLHARNIVKPVSTAYNKVSSDTEVSLMTLARGNSFYDIVVPVIKKNVPAMKQEDGNDIVGSVRVGVSLSSLNAELRNILIVSISITVVIIALSIGIASAFVRMITGRAATKPVREPSAPTPSKRRRNCQEDQDEVGVLG